MAGNRLFSSKESKTESRKLSFDGIRYLYAFYAKFGGGDEWGEQLATIQEVITSVVPDKIFQSISASKTGLFRPLEKLVSEYASDPSVHPVDFKSLPREQQFILAMLLEDKVLEENNEINPAFRQVNSLLNSRLGKHFYMDDSLLTPYANDCNKTYIGTLLVDACLSLQSVQDELKIDDLTAQLISSELNMTQFKKCLSKTRWNTTLDDRAEKLFSLATNMGAKQTISLLNYLQLIVWLGDPSLSADQVMPADLAIDFYCDILSKKQSVRKLFQCFRSVHEFDCLTMEEKEKMGPVLRFNGGRLSFSDNLKPVFFHRNLVLTYSIGHEGVDHQPVFMFDSKAGIIRGNGIFIEKMRRATNALILRRKAYQQLELDRTLLISFNIAHKQQILEDRFISGPGVPNESLLFAAMALKHSTGDKLPPRFSRDLMP